ncbi:hypothetical protein BD408DRAFT_417261 [Parasitella parasitica]|nr:hypothetical protein BD408DRAFT_417261 [Parasitella parasitica]
MISYGLRKWMFIIALFSITCITAILMLQVIYSDDFSLDRQYSSNLAVEIMPSIKIQVEWLHLLVIILYTAGLAMTCTTYIHWYFAPLTILIVIQWIYATLALLDQEAYIMDQLQLSWQATYKDSLFILENIQNLWHCQGFSTIFDHPAYILTENVDDIKACYPILSEMFGTTIILWGIGLWVVKIIQIIGLLACYALYIYIHHESEQTDEEKGPIQLPEDSDTECYTDEDEEERTQEYHFKPCSLFQSKYHS